MNYNKHSELDGKHAALSPSKHNSWANKTPEELMVYLARCRASEVGTALHDIARKHISRRCKLTKAAKNEVFLSLVEDYKIPEFVIDLGLDYDYVYENLVIYVNDAIKFRLEPEVVLKYSDNAFGTADAISKLDDILLNHKLVVFDLKTGTTPVHIEQLIDYVCYVCLEYNIKPGDLTEIDLRIYQTAKDEVLCYTPTIDEIAHTIDDIIMKDKYISKVKEEN